MSQVSAASADGPLPATAPLGELLYHYTKACRGLEYILKDGTVRVSPFGTMDDPREAKEWTVTVVTSDPTYGGIDLNEISREFNDHLKRKVKVACFTADAERKTEPATILARGWAHPRMWASYADDHAGLCFAFRRTPLVERFEAQFAGLAREPYA